MVPTADPGYSETCPCEAKSAARARSLVRAALRTWKLEQLIDDGTLIVSELVGNSVRHSNCRLVHVSVSLTGPGRVRLSVSDTSTTVPVKQEAGEDDTTGRGLQLVDALAHQWGTDLRRGKKIVWADLVAGGEPA
ncbi:ATP-binding protein [Streptomyces montanisoli]|uniref:ATP-binding protein n=1 Tax=Streptomyces montanisoli TaxID=2798581 RepID=UPI001FD76A00|nr:ATP-binding protein [Streptomyces montanisoli]